MDDRIDVRQRLDLHNISIDFAAASARRCGFTISTAAGSASSPTGTTALVSCRTSAATLSAHLVPCAASQPLPQTHR
jgi:hypothetical protein